jgi:hypothetical protein
MASNMTPDEFEKLPKAAMVAQLKAINQRSAGNKPDLSRRYKEWHSAAQVC